MAISKRPRSSIRTSTRYTSNRLARRPRLEPLEDRRLLALEAHLLSDVNAQGAGSNPAQFIELGGYSYFSSTDLENGDALWRTDGTPGGTQLLKDPNPSGPTANIRGLFKFGEQLLFFANDGEHGNELWSSDGTAAGTSLLYDIEPGAGNSNSYTITMAELDGKVYFNAFQDGTGKELWVTDGTTSGTHLAVDIMPGESQSFPYELTEMNGKLYFGARRDGEEFELWTTDGTPEGTELVKDISPGPGSSFPTHFPTRHFVRVGDELFFAANDGEHGRELWKTDGTTAGTVLVQDTNPGPGSGYPQFLINVNDTLYFEGFFELWKSDGTPAGTTRIKDDNPNNFFEPTSLVELDGLVYFNANDGVTGRELWRTDGTEAGTTLVKDFNAGPASSLAIFTPMVVHDQRLYFAAGDDEAGLELWSSDGSTEGTSRVEDLNPGPASSLTGVDSLFSFGDRLLIGADDGHVGVEPRSLDSLGGGTTLLKDINLGTRSSNPRQVAGLGSELAFVADDGLHGREPWASDGTPGGTRLIRDIWPGSEGSRNYTGFKELGGKLYFGSADSQFNSQLWTTDLTNEGTVPVSEAGSPLYPTGLTAFNGSLYFAGESGAEVGNELWKSDGTTAGTSILKDFFPGKYDFSCCGGYTATFPNGLFPQSFTSFAGKLFFNGGDEAGRELWSTDGTVEGTARMLDLLVGEGADIYGNVIRFGGNPTDLTVVDGKLYFVATSAETGRELWTTDGTVAGTHVVRDILPGGGEPDPYGGVPYSSSPTHLIAGAGKLYFFADDGVHGRELWVSDGTEDGTSLVHDVFLGPYSSTGPYQLPPRVGDDGRLYFVADDGEHGAELWVSDGTEQGTLLLRDVNSGPAPGPILYSQQTLATIGNRVFFIANDGTHGRELWTSDGTELGTFLVQDILPGSAAGLSQSQLTAIEGSLYFGADDGQHGVELWTIPAAEVDFILGDTDNDRDVDMQDLNNVRNAFGNHGFGDADGDDDIDLNDLNAVRNNFGNSENNALRTRQVAIHKSSRVDPNLLSLNSLKPAQSQREIESNAARANQGAVKSGDLSNLTFAERARGNSSPNRQLTTPRRLPLSTIRATGSANASADEATKLAPSGARDAADARDTLFSLWPFTSLEAKHGKRRKS